MNPFDEAAAGMVDLFYQTGGVSVIYKRGEQSVTLTVLAESPRMDKWAGEPGKVSASDMTFTIRAAGLIIDSLITAPKIRDKIIYAEYLYDVGSPELIEKLDGTGEWKITAKRTGREA